MRFQEHSEYRGVVDATIDGQEQHLPIKVSFDPKSQAAEGGMLTSISEPPPD